jgi:hypothetical protein
MGDTNNEVAFGANTAEFGEVANTAEFYGDEVEGRELAIVDEESGDLLSWGIQDCQHCIDASYGWERYYQRLSPKMRFYACAGKHELYGTFVGPKKGKEPCRIWLQLSRDFNRRKFKGEKGALQIALKYHDQGYQHPEIDWSSKRLKGKS